MSSESEQKQSTTNNAYNSQLYGSTTGSSYNPTDFQKNLVSGTEQGITSYMNQLMNPTYDSSVFQAQTDMRNQLANQSFENNLINPLASRGLTRGSSVAQMGNEFANTLAQQETQAMANEDARNQAILQSLLGLYQVPLQTMQAVNPMGGQTTTSTTSQDMTGQILGMGAQLGSAALMSDKRLKENINKLDEVEGVSIYEYNYIGEEARQVGVIAQEIKEDYPEAVILLDNGFYAVDYSELPEAVNKKIGEHK